MTEEEINKKIADIQKREQRISQAERGLSSRIAKLKNLHDLVKDNSDLVKILHSSGIKKPEDLSKFVEVSKPKAETKMKEEEVGLSKEDLAQIKELMVETVDERLKGVKQDVQAVRSVATSQELHKDLKSHFEKAPGSLIKNYFKEDPEEVVNSYIQALEGNPDLTVETFSEEMNKVGEAAIKKFGGTPPTFEEEKKEEKAEEKTEVNLEEKSVAGSGGAPSSGEKSSEELSKMTEEQKDEYFVKKAEEISKEEEE